MRNLRIDITIPVLNEEHRLNTCIVTLVQFLDKCGIENYYIIIVDNGSIDGTEAVSRELVARFSKVSFLKVPRKGLGLALKHSWGLSNADLVGYMDVDLATNLVHLKEAYQALHQESIDIVNGSRLLQDSRVTNRSLVRNIMSEGFNFLLRNLLDVHFTDGMCGFKFLKKTTYDQLAKKGINNEDLFFCTELLVKAEWIGIKIFEIPVMWTDDRDSRIKLIETTTQYLKEIYRLKAEKAQKLQ